MAFYAYRLPMIGFYEIRIEKDMTFLADIRFDDEDKDAQKSYVKLALLATYDGIDGTLRNHGITLDDLPDMFAAFMMGRPYKDLVLKFVEVGPKRLSFLVAVTSYENKETFAITLYFGDTRGEFSISDRSDSESYVLNWRHGLLDTIRQTINYERKIFQIQFSRRNETLAADADLSDAIVTITEENPLPARPYHDDD